MLYLTRKVEFEASHRYALPDLSEEENRRLFGKCYGVYGHGHNYVCWATVGGEIDPETGEVMDIKALDTLLKRVVGEFDHTFINLQHPTFHDRNPTLENLSRYLWERIIPELPEGVILSQIRLDEEPTFYAEYTGTGGMVYLTKIFMFSAAHRLHHPDLSDAENETLYGKCNNPHGHGHNYQLEVTVRGEVDEQTGMSLDLGEMERVVEEEVIDRFDHHHLNEEVEEFREVNPTSEHVVKVIWDLLKPRLPGLSRVALWETPKSRFEYHGT
ncbi:MAG: 6-carboxytetrahydropterin synthase [Candidatus Latescibacteria bacterium]|nr:6-carboxytetrahydropterin synthase [Candidatus Latescibacterota bacterium]